MIMLTRSSWDVNPARAGMILMVMLRTQFRHGKPRASGDDPGVNCATDIAVDVNPARAGMILASSLV